ncbi:hypothetical protein JYU34_016120 [Plutella xylostella]|uniref:Uncharacterized protein n=1 Tax=Plutella xylostella TaxID=51655 RepID=A0ABQ7Q968_PLUXY|nr:hypothetical protein JYU34_016120 [Plutella xylostella]
MFPGLTPTPDNRFPASTPVPWDREIGQNPWGGRATSQSQLSETPEIIHVVAPTPPGLTTQRRHLLRHQKDTFKKSCATKPLNTQRIRASAAGQLAPLK